MINDVLLGIGLVAIVEGLVLALAPNRLREVLELIERLDTDRRRLLGLSAIGVGVALVWVTRG